MSVVKAQMADKKKPKGKNARRFSRTGDIEGADWGGVDAMKIRDLISCASRAGGAIRFGYTADGGAYAIGVYGDGPDAYTEYVRPGEDVAGVLEGITDAFWAAAEEDKK